MFVCRASPVPRAPCRSCGDGHAQEGSTGGELLAARSIPRPGSVAGGSESSEHSPGAGGSTGRAAPAGTQPLPSIQQTQRGRSSLQVCLDPSRIIPCPSRHIPVAAAAARTPSAPSASSPHPWQGCPGQSHPRQGSLLSPGVFASIALKKELQLLQVYRGRTGGGERLCVLSHIHVQCLPVLPAGRFGSFPSK